DDRAALRTWHDRRTFGQDVNATVTDLFGLLGQRDKLPYASLLHGRSLLHAASPAEPDVVMSTTSGVWENDRAAHGIMRGDRLLVGAEGAPWICYDQNGDPTQVIPLEVARCGNMIEVARR